MLTIVRYAVALALLLMFITPLLSFDGDDTDDCPAPASAPESRLADCR